jgi:hypothetical protein
MKAAETLQETSNHLIKLTDFSYEMAITIEPASMPLAPSSDQIKHFATVSCAHVGKERRHGGTKSGVHIHTEFGELATQLAPTHCPEADRTRLAASTTIS